MTEERTGKGQPMTDDTWRRDRDDEEDESLFGEHEPTRDQEAVDDGLTFGASDTGSLPHWTEPPTGEVPRLDPEADVTAAERSATTTSSTCGRRSRPSRRSGRTIRRPNRAPTPGRAFAVPDSTR